jgi:2-hydroxychromene-2-carboxylate isomerase
VPHGFDGPGAGTTNGKPLFTADEVQAIMRAAGSEEMKAVLKGTTQEALDRGAFGAPWLWVSADGKEGEPFFGSDR